MVWYIMGGRCNKSYDTENSSSQYFSAEQTTQCILRFQRRVTYRNGLGTYYLVFWISAWLNVPAVLVQSCSGAVSKCSAKQSISTLCLSIEAREPIKGLQVVRLYVCQCLNHGMCVAHSGCLRLGLCICLCV